MTVSLGLHGALVLALVLRLGAPPEPLAAPPAPVLLSLEMLAAPPAPAPSQEPDKAPSPPRTAPPEPPRIQPRAPRQVADAPFTLPPPRPAQPTPSTAPSPSLSEAAPPQRAPAPPAAVASGSVEATWQGLVLARLEAQRRYPRLARERRAQGVVHVRFRMTRDGKVVSSLIARSSGQADLDREALATVARAQPLPPPPPEIAGGVLELVVPVEFFLR